MPQRDLKYPPTARQAELPVEQWADRDRAVALCSWLPRRRGSRQGQRAEELVVRDPLTANRQQ